MFMNFGAFAVITLLAGPEGDRDSFSDLEGLARRSPAMAILMSIFMLSLAGFPPSVGFFGKLFLFTAGVSAGYTWLVVLAVVMSVVSVFYYVRVLIPVWSTSSRTDRLPASITTTSVVGLSGVASIALGLYPTTLLIVERLREPALPCLGSLGAFEPLRMFLLVREGELLPSGGHLLVLCHRFGEVGRRLDQPRRGVDLELDRDGVAKPHARRILDRFQDAQAIRAVAHRHERAAVGLSGDHGLDLRQAFEAQARRRRPSGPGPNSLHRHPASV